MKKSAITSVVLIVSILFSSCSKSTVIPKNIDKLIACFGQDKSEIFKAMNLTEEEARDTSEPFDNDNPFMIPLKKRQMILDSEMIPILRILSDEKTVHSIEYHQVYADTKYAFELAKKIDKQLSSAYKVDVTFAGRSISDVPSLEIFTEMSQGYATEWIYKDDVNIRLSVSVRLATETNPESRIIIEVYFNQIDREKYMPKIYN